MFRPVPRVPLAASAIALMIATTSAWAGNPPVVAPLPLIQTQVGQTFSIDLMTYVTQTDGDPVKIFVGFNGGFCETPGLSSDYNAYDVNVGLYSATGIAPGTVTCDVLAEDKDGVASLQTLTVVIAPAAPSGVAAVPALAPAGLGVLSALLAGVGVLRRRQRGCQP